LEIENGKITDVISQHLTLLLLGSDFKQSILWNVYCKAGDG